MEARAVQRHVRQSARKMRLVVDLIRGRSVPEAYAILRFSKKHAALQIRKVLTSAVANAKQAADRQNERLDEDQLRVDYAVLLWATIPWLWRHPHPLWWLTPSEWPRVATAFRTGASAWATTFRTDPDHGAERAGRAMSQRLRSFLGLGAG